MTREEAIKILKGLRPQPQRGDGKSTTHLIVTEALNMAIEALKTLEDFERAQIITGGRLNGRTFAYKRGLEDGKRKAIEQEPCEDMGEVSDGYHTFNQLYHQRAILFATIVNQNKNLAWKSYKHSDGNYCFDSNGEWFIVGIDTPEGSYTYHYQKEYWDYFECKELDCGKEWDGHTEEDVTRLLSLKPVPCKDCVSRQAVHDGMIKYGFHAFDMTITEFVEDVLPPVTPTTNWIPCSERLPEEADIYLVTIDDKKYGKRVEAIWYEGEKLGWDFRITDDVIAWLPLPKPYNKCDECLFDCAESEGRNDKRRSNK